MEKISDRVHRIIENEELTFRAFEKKIKCSNGLISRFVKNGQSKDEANFTDISGRWLSIIIETFPKYDARWLLTGKGNMFMGDNRPTTDGDIKPADKEARKPNSSNKPCRECELKDMIIVNQGREIETQAQFIRFLQDKK